MLYLLREVRVLRQEGKLHEKLISRMRMLFIIALILFGIVIFNLIFRGLDFFTAGALWGIGFLLGLYIFSRMSSVNWNEDDEMVQAASMDALGYASVGLYIVFEIGLRTFLHNAYPVSATVFVLSGICGTLLGRGMGMVMEIRRVFRATL